MTVTRPTVVFTVHEIQRLAGEGVSWQGNYVGDISGIASLEQAQEGDLSFLSNPKYQKQAIGSKASVLLVSADFAYEPGPNQVFGRTAHPSLVLARICAAIESRLLPDPEPGVHPLASVSPSAHVHPTAYVGPFCVIEAGVEVSADVILTSHVSVGRGTFLGERTRVFPYVVIYPYCAIGSRCRIHAGSVIGSDGFGYSTVQGVHHKEPQIGNVVIEDEVEIGANTCIDRARFDATVIERGVKIDNLVQIAHNVRVGAGSILVSQVGISGSTSLGNYVVVGGQAGIAGHLKIGDQAMIGGQSGINRDVDPGEKVRGTPHLSMQEFARISILQRRLPEFFKRLDKIESLVGSASA